MTDPSDAAAPGEAEDLRAENQRLQRINAALIERVESGSSLSAAPYAAFEHAVALAEQVRERTDALSQALNELKRTNHALTQEIQERRLMEARLTDAKAEAERANLSKTKFLAAVSHDLLQPLNAARLFAGALADQSLPLHTANLVQSLGRSLEDVETLLGTLVDISKLDAGAVKADITEAPLQPLLSNLADEYQHISSAHGRRFTAVPSTAWVRTDPALLLRILRNLLANAVRYTPPGARILLGVRRRSGAGQPQVSIEVWDQGAGIPESELTAIFGEFKRLDHTRDAADKGLGLGLAIVDKISRMLAHPIGVRSELGRGSVFSVTLPAVPAPSQPQRHSGHAEGPATLVGLKVWVIDNDREIGRAMHALLTGWGCQVCTAPSLDDLAKQRDWRTAPVDVVILDYHLDGDQTGSDLARRLRRERTAPPQVLMITANHSQTLREQIRHEGHTLLHKPVKPLKLRTTLAYLKPTS
ncbi:MAG: ATP-binding response regulator [Saccharospirillum sp.]